MSKLAAEMSKLADDMPKLAAEMSKPAEITKSAENGKIRQKKCQNLPQKWQISPDRLIFYTVYICSKLFPRFLYYYFINN